MDERQRYREVLAINRAIANAQAYDEVLRLVVERTAAFTSATACLLILSQADGLGRVVRSVGIDPAKAARLAVPLTERVDRELCQLLGFQSPDRFVGVPVIGEEGLLGILAVYWEGAPVLDGPYDEELLSALADQAAIALDNAERVHRLRASEEKLAGIISIAADAIVSLDQAQRIVMFNQGAEKIFGWSRGEVLGKPLDLLVPERFRVSHQQHVPSFGAGSDTARAMGQRSTAIFGLRKSGEEFPIDAAISRLHDGATWIYTVVLRDITEQKRIEHEEMFLAEVGTVLAETLDFESTLTSIAQLAMRDNADFCAIDFVDELGELRRLAVAGSDPAKAAIYEALERFPFDRSRPHLSWAVLQSKQPQILAEISADALQAMAQSDEHRRLLEALAPTSLMGVPLIVRGRLLGALVVAWCRPERRYQASDLRLLTELGRRAAFALENARLYRTTQRAVQTRDDVLGIVAHDLRNPLNTIILQATLLRRLEAELSPRARKSGKAIERAATRMNRLIQDLLDTKRMEGGSLSVEPARMPAAQVILASEDAHRALVASSSLQLRVEIAPGLPDIWGDRDRLLQVFENLLGNAIKFTPPGGRITVGARPGEGEIVFWVEDTGEGIPEADLPRLFDRFWQARKAGRRGVGLGLPIAKAIIDAHGGRIWVDSVPGQGSTFHFTVPVA